MEFFFIHYCVDDQTKILIVSYNITQLLILKTKIYEVYIKYYFHRAFPYTYYYIQKINIKFLQYNDIYFNYTIVYNILMSKLIFPRVLNYKII